MFELKLPEGNLIKRWMKYRARISGEIPEATHASIIAVASALIDKHVYVRLHPRNIHANVWVMDVDPPSISGKSVAFDGSGNIIRVIEPQLLLSDIHGSFPALLEDLEGTVRTEKYRDHGISINDECDTLLALINQPSMSGMRGLMCSLFDCTPRKRTLKRAKDKIPSINVQDPYFVLCWSTTPDTFFENTRRVDVLSGFLLRFLIYHHEEEIPFHENIIPSNEDDSEYAALLSDFSRRFRYIQGKINQPLVVEQRSLDLHNQLRKEFWKQNTDIDRSLSQRMAMYAMKLAIIYTVMDEKFESSLFILNHDCLVEATREIKEYFFPTALRMLRGVNDEAKFSGIDKIAKEMRRYGKEISHSDLLRRTHLKSKEFNECIDTMVESGELEERTIRATNGKTQTFYKIADKIEIDVAPKIPIKTGKDITLADVFPKEVTMKPRDVA